MFEIEYNKLTRESIIEEQEANGMVLYEDKTTGRGKTRKLFLVFMTEDEHFKLIVRPMRNQMLRDTDFLMLADNFERMTVEEQNQLKVYRQSLRDISKKAKDLPQPMEKAKYILDQAVGNRP